MVRSLGRGLRLRFFAGGGQSWRVESSESWDDGVGNRVDGSGDDRGDGGKELKSEMSDRSHSMLSMTKRVG